MVMVYCDTSSGDMYRQVLATVTRVDVKKRRVEVSYDRRHGCKKTPPATTLDFHLVVRMLDEAVITQEIADEYEFKHFDENGNYEVRRLHYAREIVMPVEVPLVEPLEDGKKGKKKGKEVSVTFIYMAVEYVDYPRKGDWYFIPEPDYPHPIPSYRDPEGLLDNFDQMLFEFGVSARMPTSSSCRIIALVEWMPADGDYINDDLKRQKIDLSQIGDGHLTNSNREVISPGSVEEGDQIRVCWVFQRFFVAPGNDEDDCLELCQVISIRNEDGEDGDDGGGDDDAAVVHADQPPVVDGDDDDDNADPVDKGLAMALRESAAAAVDADESTGIVSSILAAHESASKKQAGDGRTSADDMDVDDEDEPDLAASPPHYGTMVDLLQEPLVDTPGGLRLSVDDSTEEHDLPPSKHAAPGPAEDNEAKKSRSDEPQDEDQSFVLSDVRIFKTNLLIDCPPFH